MSTPSSSEDGGYLFPAQLDKCALCYRALGETVWRRRVLPWVFCSQACCAQYFDKDGRTPPSSSVAEGEKT